MVRHTEFLIYCKLMVWEIQLFKGKPNCERIKSREIRWVGNAALWRNQKYKDNFEW